MIKSLLLLLLSFIITSLDFYVNGQDLNVIQDRLQLSGKEENRLPGAQDIKQVYENARLQNPNGCRTLYYELFINSKEKDLTVSESSLVKESALEQFSKTQEQYTASLSAYPFSQYTPQVEELISRIKATKLEVLTKSDFDRLGMSQNYKSGAFFLPFTPKSSQVLLKGLRAECPENLPTESIGTDLMGQSIYPQKNGDRHTVRATDLTFAGPYGKGRAAFTLGHELTHSLNWGPPEIIDCLTDPRSIAARRTKSLVWRSGSELQLDEKIFQSVLKMNFTEIQRIETFSLVGEVSDKLKKIHPPQKFEVSPVVRDLISEAVSSVPALQLMHSEAPRSFEYLMATDLDFNLTVINLLPVRQPPVQFDRRGFFRMGSDEGYGTEFYGLIQDELRSGDFRASLKILNEARRSGRLPEQTFEAFGDFMGTRMAVQTIREQFPGDTQEIRNHRREAAKEILKLFPPELLKRAESEILNQAGSKKTPEERVFKILFADAEFRDLLGCQMEDPIPLDCNAMTNKKN